MKIIHVLNICILLFLWVYVAHKNILTWTYFNTNIITIVLLILHMSISLLLINFLIYVAYCYIVHIMLHVSRQACESCARSHDY